MGLMEAFGVDRVGRRRPGLFASPRTILLLAPFLLLGGCGELPAIGPTVGEVEGGQSFQTTNPFVVIDVDKKIVATLGGLKSEGFGGRFESRAPRPNLLIGVGDTLQINVIEQTPGGVFSSQTTTTAAPGANSILPGPMSIQPSQVGADGSIVVPFAGRVIAAGRTVESVRADIESKLATKAILPQVQVMVLSSTGVSSNSATVGGEVNRAGIYPLPPSGNRLLDLVAEAGGARYPAYETVIYLTRHGQRHSTSLQTLIERPRDNVFIYPHDDIYLSRNERTFSVLGASTKVGRYGFETPHVNLAEAVAIGGGFADASADPSGVYVFRYETASLVRAFRPDTQLGEDATIPVLYRVNLRGGDGYFLSTTFEIRDKDVVLLANSDGAQFEKLLNILQNGTNIALTAKTLGQNNSVVLSTISTATTAGK